MTEIPLHPPVEWFTPPSDMPKDAGCIVESDGRIYGYLCHWGSVLMDGSTDKWKAPRSKNGYAFAHTGDTLLEDGSLLKTGNLGGDLGHAPMGAGDLAATQDWYANTQTQLARIRYGEDKHGVWFAGACWPTVTEFDIAKLRASARSGHWAALGDWRDLHSGKAGYELVGACLVNVPGLKYARADKAASGVLSFNPMQFGVAGTTDLPLHTDREYVWDGAAAEDRVRKWASGDGSGNQDTIDWAAYRSLHVWYDPNNAEEFGGYDLLFADVFDHEPRAVLSGAVMVAAAIGGFPEADSADLQARVAGLYARFATEFDDATIIPPWQASASERVASSGTAELAAQANAVSVGGVLLVEGAPTEDGRLIESGATEWRDVPLPLYSSLKNLPGHDSANLVGRIDSIWRDEVNPNHIMYSATIFPASDAGAGQDTLDAIANGMLTGISIDGIVGPNDSYVNDDDVSVMSKIIVGGATLTPMPAMQDASVTLLSTSTKEFAMTDETVIEDAAVAVDGTTPNDAAPSPDVVTALQDQVASVADRVEYLIGLIETWQQNMRYEQAASRIRN